MDCRLTGMSDLSMSMDEALSEADLDAMAEQAAAASPGSWVP
jgi:hypothetical protein